MFANVGWGEMMVLVILGLVILGPERLPGAIRWCSNALRQARDYVNASTKNLRDELGPEFDDLREPLSELQKLRGMTPRSALTKHLLDGDDSILTGDFDKPVDASAGSGDPGAEPAAGSSDQVAGESENGEAQPKPQSSGGPTPFDIDAT